MIFYFIFFINLVSGLIWIEPSTDLDYNFNQNQAFQSEVGKTYYRLPPRAQNIVRSRIWQLSRHSASISIKFITNSSTLKVQYQHESPNAFQMMSQLGTSGIDLYGYDENGEVHFFSGTYTLESTAVFNFNDYNASTMFSYLLILPSYDVVKPGTLKIGYEADSYFKIYEKERELPITTYGTSIMHGACPNRPGLTWINWMSRELSLPVYNFGFMGQGILEKEVIDFVIEEESRLFIVDCLPNLVFDTIETVVQRTIDAYKQIRQKWSNTPIVLVEFGGYTNYEFSNVYRGYTDNMNVAAKLALKKLTEEENATNLFYVTKEELQITSDDISDPVHPMDNGMNKQKSAVVKKLREILSMPFSEDFYSTQKAVQQHRNIEFVSNHQKILKEITEKIEVENGQYTALVGDDVFSKWPAVDADSWFNLNSNGFLNLGIEKDRIENVLFRVYHDEMRFIRFKSVVALAGSNNLAVNNVTEIVEGVKFLTNQIAVRQKEAKIVVCGILPRSGFEEKVRNINNEIKVAAENENWSFSDLGEGLLDEKTGLINEEYFVDGINLNKKGYEKIAPIIAGL